MMNVEYCGTITCGEPSIEKIKDEMVVSAKEGLDGESSKQICDEHLESATKKEVSRATKAAHDKKKMMKEPHPPPLDIMPHTLTLHPMKFKDGAIEYKIKCKGKSTPFSSAKAIITPQLQDDPIKLQELLSQILTITLERTSLGEFSKIPKGHVENSKVTTSHPSSFPFSHDSQLQVSAFYLYKYLVIMFMSFP
ncbi:hypothetical protein Bca52824_040868 [Brassica carinata]|uniref:Uncharacterized protein n=1 Tax=Brassica carinata TaxID=52824 RepID=A0A8X7RS31_BRACI|nr:hypothetical protein Bca52824_040868 [Brassica carinata]